MEAAVAPVLAIVLVLAACGAAGTSPCRGEQAPLDEPPLHHDPELEARIPDTVGDAPLDLQSICAGAGQVGGTNMTPEFLDEVGVEADDVSMAVTNPAIGGAFDGSLSAFRYYGASEDAIRTAMLDAMRETGEGVGEENRAGKSLSVARGPFMNGSVIYVADDTLYLLSGVEEQVDELLAGLP
jgi:hypothetical protein